MKKKNSLAVKNLMRRPGRTVALTVVALLLAFFIMAGTLIVYGLRSGLNSLDSRLGADIMVVPFEATTKQDFSEMLLQGTTTTMYMDRSVMDEIAEIEGIEKMSEQFYLATASASCCSSRLQIIGYDPETDFTVSPWIKTSYDTELGYMEIVVGNDLNLFPGEQMKFYDCLVTVKARMEKTGTYLDTSVYANEETIKTLIESARDTKMIDFGNVSPDNIISCIMIDVADGYTIEDVVNYINLYVDDVKAIQTQAFITDVTSSMNQISSIIGGLIAAIWALALIILLMSYIMIANERKKEFAVIRVLGASKKMLASILIKEMILISVGGSVIGGLLGVGLVELFANHIETAIGLPFLLPGAAGMLLLLAAAIAVSVLGGWIAAAISANRISKQDTALILRGDN